MSEIRFDPTGARLPDQSSSPEFAANQALPRDYRTLKGPKEPNPTWVSFKAFMKVHWRITLAIIFTIGVVVMPFAGEAAVDKVGGTVMYFVGAVVFWTLHKRHVARQETADKDTKACSIDRFDTTIEDGWSRRLANCREKAGVFNEVATATQPDAVRAWLVSMSDNIDAQLVQATDLAALGRAIEPEFDEATTPSNSAAKEAWSRLTEFETGLADAVTRAAEIRLNSVSPASNLDPIRGQLDMLQSQLPTLDPR